MNTTSRPLKIIQTAILIYAIVSSDFLLKAQNVSFQNVYGSTAQEDPTDLIQCSNGELVATGNTTIGQWPNAIIFRVNDLGTILWSKAMTSNSTGGISIEKGVETLDGGLCFLGSFIDYAPHDSNKIALVKTDGAGQIQWTQSIDGPSSLGFSFASDFFQGGDSCYYICGHEKISSSVSIPLVLKINPNGQLAWSKTINCGNTKALVLAPNNNDRIATAILDSVNGNLIIVELDSTGTFVGSVDLIAPSGYPITSVSAAKFDTLNLRYLFCVNSEIPYFNANETNWRIYFDSNLALAGAIPMTRPGDSLQIVAVMYSQPYKDVYLLHSRTGASKTLTMDTDAIPFARGTFIDTLTNSMPVNFAYLNNQAMMILSETQIANTPEDFLLTRTLDPISILPDIPIDACHSLGTGSVAGSHGFVLSPSTYSFNNSAALTAISPVAISVSTYPMTVSANCSMVGIAELRIDSITVNNLVRETEHFVAANLPVGSSLVVYNMHGQIIYESANYQNELLAAQLGIGLFLYEFTLPDGKRKTGKLVVQ